MIMRLRNIYIICRDNIETIDTISFAQLTGSYSGYWQVTGWEKASKVIVNELFSIEFLKEKAEELIKCIPEIYQTFDSFKVLSSEGNKILTARKMLRESMADVISLYESMGLEPKESLGVDVRLPDCKDFAELKKCIDDLDFILYKNPLFRDETENLEFKSADVGSLWLTFAVIGAGAVSTSIFLNNLVAFLDKCVVVHSHRLTLQQQKVQVEAMKMEKEAKETFLNSLEQLYKSQVATVVHELEKETNKKLQNGEEIGIVEQAFEKMNILLEKGLQIYSTIESPQEVKALFEPLEMKYISVSSGTKLIEEKTEENE